MTASSGLLRLKANKTVTCIVSKRRALMLMYWLRVQVAAVSSHNSLELSSVAESMLDHCVTGAQHIFTGLAVLFVGEVYSPIFCPPASLLGKLDDCALAVEKEEVFSVADWYRRIGFLAAGSDFGADCVNEDLKYAHQPGA